MSTLDSLLPDPASDIEDLAHSMALIRHYEARRPRTPMRSRSAPLAETPESDFADDRFVDHTDSLERIRSAQRDIVANGEKPGGGGPEGFPDPYYAPGP